MVWWRAAGQVWGVVLRTNTVRDAWQRAHGVLGLRKEGAPLDMTRLPTDRERWEALVRSALAPGDAVPIDQLLLVRDLLGAMMRTLEPPLGVVARSGAVLILLYPDGPDLRLPLTVRSHLLPNHRGEVSLPGGAIDPDDADVAAAALRECWEELGVAPQQVTVWGQLAPVYIQASNFSITPVVGFCPHPPTLQINGAEVSAVITVTLRELLDPGGVVVEQWSLSGSQVQVPFFAIAGHKVWGATALVLSELIARIRRALGPVESNEPLGSSAASQPGA
jgi:8-oxo-dGTP pyrophosphatase MutT (NUDIX family)